MTIQGAIAELNNLLKADDVPFYYEGSIKKVIETIEMEFEDVIPLSAIEDIKAEIENRRDEIKEVADKNKTISMKGFVLGLDRALEIIDRKVNEVAHE